MGRPGLGFVWTLPFLLLLPPGPAQGNVGGAIGSCRCERSVHKPAMVARFAHKLLSCGSCIDLVKFVFPKRSVCGLPDAKWVVDFKNSHCPEGAVKADASRGHHLLVPTTSSLATVSTQVAAGPAGATSEETPRTQAAPANPTDAAWVHAQPSEVPSAEGSGKSWQQQASRSRTAVLSLLCITLALAGVMAGLLCWKKHGRGKRTRRCAGEPGEETHFPPLEET